MDWDSYAAHCTIMGQRYAKRFKERLGFAKRRGVLRPPADGIPCPTSKCVGVVYAVVDDNANLCYIGITSDTPLERMKKHWGNRNSASKGKQLFSQYLRTRESPPYIFPIHVFQRSLWERHDTREKNKVFQAIAEPLEMLCISILKPLYNGTRTTERLGSATEDGEDDTPNGTVVREFLFNFS